MTTMTNKKKTEKNKKNTSTMRQATATSKRSQPKFNTLKAAPLSQTSLLYDIYQGISEKSGSGLFYTVMDLPEGRDNDLAALLDMNLIQMPPSGNGAIILTDQGKRAVSNGIIKIYPLPPRGTTKDYNNTLSTMSPAAANALMASINTIGAVWLNKISATKLGRFLEILFTHGIAKTLSINDKQNLFNSSLRLYFNTLFTADQNKAFSDARDTIDSLHFKMLSQLSRKVSDLGGIKLRSSVYCNSIKKDITGLEIIADQLHLNTKDSLNGESSNVIASSCVSHHDMCSILSQLT